MALIIIIRCTHWVNLNTSSLLNSNHGWNILNEACSDNSVIFGLMFWIILLYISEHYDIDVLPQKGKKEYQMLC